MNQYVQTGPIVWSRSVCADHKLKRQAPTYWQWVSVCLIQTNWPAVNIISMLLIQSDICMCCVVTWKNYMDGLECFAIREIFHSSCGSSSSKQRKKHSEQAAIYVLPGEYPARRAACLDSAKLFGVKSLRLQHWSEIIEIIKDNEYIHDVSCF